MKAVHDGDAADDSATVTHVAATTVPDVAVTVDDDETVSIVLSKTSLVDGDGAVVEVTVTVTARTPRTLR